MFLLPATSHRLLAAVPVLACLYLPFIGGGLLTDDFAHVEHLTRIESAARIVNSPDTFGFYRPVTQASLAVLPGVQGQRPALARALNIVLHAGVIALAFLVARLVLESSLAAGLAALAFALTPKAHPIAVLWISARAELLMAAFTLAALAAWIVWTRGGRWTWLAAAAVAYVLALSSKETATLLPLLLLFTPRNQRPWTSRAAAGAMLAGLAVIFYVWRAHVGALTPFSGDAHYDLLAPLARWTRSATNYTGRMIVAPLGLIVLVGLARLTTVSLQRRAEASASADTRTLKRALYGDVLVIGFAAAFVVAFLAPVLPITLRSELYLYLPVFGVCLFVGWLSSLLFSRIEPRPLLIALGIYVIGLAGYQIARARERHRDLVFSEKLVAALRTTPLLADRDGRVLLEASDAETERLLRDTVGGYFYLVLQYARHDARHTGDVHYRGDPPRQADVRLVCAYRQDGTGVVISPAP
jgi:hypothetical protein